MFIFMSFRAAKLTSCWLDLHSQHLGISLIKLLSKKPICALTTYHPTYYTTGFPIKG